jgi:hypothetical protein
VVGIPVFRVGGPFIAVFDCFVELNSNFSRFSSTRVSCDFVYIALPTMFVEDVTVAS